MKFSIILPVYNKAHTIIQALDSIYAQTYQDFEVIVINDGSTDNVLDVLNEYDKPIRVISQDNKGVSVARNAGIDSSKGDYVCFLDADDMWYPNHLEVLVGMMSLYSNEKYFGTCHKCSFPDGSVIECNKRINNFEDVFLVKDYIGFVNKYGGLINTNSICIRRNVLINENLRFEPGEKMGEDVDVWYRIALKHPIVVTKQITTLYRREHSTATAKSSNPPDWCFARRIDSILNDKEVSRNIKSSVIKMCDRYYMSISRELSFNGNKTEALKRMNQVRKKLSGRFYLSLVIVLLPSVVLDLFPSKYKR